MFLFNLKKIKKNYWADKNILVKVCTKLLLWDANYDCMWTLFVHIISNGAISLNTVTIYY